MKIFTFHSDSHKDMLENYFLPTVPDDMDICVKKIPQECKSGSFESDGWMDSMRRKVQYIIDCCKTEKDIFVHSDCDIQFFKPFKEELLTIMDEHQLDLLAQEDIPGPICCGFMAIKPSTLTADMFKNVIQVMNTSNINDQHSLNHLIKSGYPVKWKTLDDRYYSVWRSIRSVWDGKQELGDIRKDIVMHHANFIEGIELKTECMDIVRQKVTGDE